MQNTPTLARKPVELPAQLTEEEMQCVKAFADMLLVRKHSYGFFVLTDSHVLLAGQMTDNARGHIMSGLRVSNIIQTETQAVILRDEVKAAKRAGAIQ